MMRRLKRQRARALRLHLCIVIALQRDTVEVAEAVEKSARDIEAQKS